jgi:hypothetical protein
MEHDVRPDRILVDQDDGRHGNGIIHKYDHRTFIQHHVLRSSICYDGDRNGLWE